MTFEEKIVRLRKIKNLTQDEFASAVGVSRQAVYKWESGQSYPEVLKLIEIKKLFGISIDDLLDDTYDVEMPEKKRKKRASKKTEKNENAEIGEETPVSENSEQAPVEENTEEPLKTDEETVEEVRENTADQEIVFTEEEPVKRKGFFSRLFSKK